MNETIKQALSLFGIDENLSTQLVKSNTQNMQTWEIGNKYFLKMMFTDKINAERIVHLNTLLRRENVPVAHYLSTKTGGVCAYVDGHYYTLADKLPGTQHKLWEFETNVEKRAYAYGKNLAQLHLALKKLDGQFEAWDNNIMDELHGWILKEIHDKQISIKQEVIDYCISFNDLYSRLPRQLIHRDPHGGNFLWINDEITGIIDFDLTQINSRIFDMCYAFAPNEANFEKWLALRPYFFSGYNEIFVINKDEMIGYAYMSVLLELLCVAFWSTISREEKLNESLKGVHWIYNVREEIKILESHLTIPK